VVIDNKKRHLFFKCVIEFEIKKIYDKLLTSYDFAWISFDIYE